MKPCKAKLPDGKLCPNQVDEGQDYCPYHLSSQVAKGKRNFSIVGGVLMVLGAIATGIYKVVKFVISKRL